MYKAIARSHLDYCVVIFHISSKQTQNGGVLNFFMNEIEKVQYQATLAITVTWAIIRLGICIRPSLVQKDPSLS